MADNISAQEQAEIDLAIQLSLGGAHVASLDSAQGVAIVISDDDSNDAPAEVADVDDSATEDESDAAPSPRPNKRKAENSNVIAQPVQSSKKAKIDKASTTNGVAVPSASSMSGIPSRAEMEKERLARQAARQALSGDSGDASSRRQIEVKPVATTLSRISTLSALAESRGDGVAAPASTSISNTGGAINGFASMAARQEATGKARRFWEGKLLPTSSRHHSGYDCLTFKDVIGDTDVLQSALLTTFCGEPDWIHSHFPSHVKIGLVMPCAEHGRPQTVDYASNMKIFNPRRCVWPYLRAVVA